MTTHVYSTNAAHRGRWLVFMAGQLVPCPALTVTYGVWQTPTAVLTFAPHYLLERIGAEDKLPVQIFYWDEFYGDAPTWRILFDGEIVGWSYANNPFSRMMQFDCMGELETYQQLHYFFMNTVDSVASIALDKGVDATALTQAGVHYPMSLFKQGLLSVSDQAPPDINGPFDLLENIMRGVVSTELPPSRRAIPSINFFSRYIRRRNLINKFVALPYFEDRTDNQEPGVFGVFKSAKSTFAVEAMQTSLAQSVGDAGSLLDTIKTVFGAVFYELAMLPNMPLVKVDITDGSIIGDPDVISKTDPNKEPLRIPCYFAKPQMTFAIPPSCNVFFKHTGVSYQENYATQPTRTYVNDSFYTSLSSMNSPQSAYATTSAFPPEIDAVLRAKQPESQVVSSSQSLPDPVGSGRNVLVYPEEFYKGPTTHRAPVPKWYTMLLNDTRNESQRADIQGGLFRLYAAYEHNRARYEKRGGNVSSQFNPYAVPGFPCVIFDSDPPGIHLTGSVMSVTHSFSKQSMSSNVGYSFGRTMREYLNLCRDESIRLGGILGAAPADPVDSTRETTQDFDQAERFYNALFFQRKPMRGSKKASFDFREVMGYIKTDGSVEPVTLTGPNQAAIGREFRRNSASDPASGEENNTPQKLEKVISNIDDSRVLAVQHGFKGALESWDVAQRFSSRPICSLDEYIRFIHGGAKIDDLVQQGIVVRSDDHYAQIRKYTAINASTPTPTPAQTGARVDELPPGLTLPTAEAYTGAPEAIPFDFPDARADWAKLLAAYRAEMKKTAPQL